MKHSIFKKENIGLFTEYGQGVDTVQHILESLGYNYEDIDRKETREYGLLAIEELLKSDIIYVTSWGKYHDILNLLELNNSQTMRYIKSIWGQETTHLEFEEMINFYFQEWYLKALKNEGIDINTDWDWFGNVFIPNLPKWIEENKPKNEL